MSHKDFKDGTRSLFDLHASGQLEAIISQIRFVSVGSRSATTESLVEVKVGLSTTDTLATASDSIVCVVCRVRFENATELRTHARLDWHVHNVRLTSTGAEPVSEEDFAAGILEKETELDKSDQSEEDNEANTTNTPNLSESLPVRKGVVADKEEFAEESSAGDERFVVFSDSAPGTPDGKRYRVLRALLVNSKQRVLDPFPLYLARFRALATSFRHFCVILASGGKFAGGLFEGTSCHTHKAFQY